MAYGPALQRKIGVSTLSQSRATIAIVTEIDPDAATRERTGLGAASPVYVVRGIEQAEDPQRGARDSPESRRREPGDREHHRRKRIHGRREPALDDVANEQRLERVERPAHHLPQDDGDCREPNEADRDLGKRVEVIRDEVVHRRSTAETDSASQLVRRGRSVQPCVGNA